MKSLVDLPARGEMLLDTINLWAHWSSYEWEKGTGVWWKNPPPYRKQYKKFYKRQQHRAAKVVTMYRLY